MNNEETKCLLGEHRCNLITLNPGGDSSHVTACTHLPEIITSPNQDAPTQQIQIEGADVSLVHKLLNSSFVKKQEERK